MLTFGKFHDEDFDGIVLKLSSSFIKLNNLEPLIKHIEEELNKCEYSMYSPDHVNNLHELKNSNQKQEIIKSQKESKLLAEKRRREYEDKLNSELIYELEYHKYTDTIMSESNLHIENNNENICIATEDDWLTNQGNLKSGIVEKIKSYVKTPDDYNNFYRCNFFNVSYQKEKHFILNINLEKLYINNRGGLSISYTVLCIKKRIKTKKGYSHYSLVPLCKKDDIYYLADHNNYEDCTKLIGYELSGMKLEKYS